VTVNVGAKPRCMVAVDETKIKADGNDDTYGLL